MPNIKINNQGKNNIMQNQNLDFINKQYNKEQGEQPTKQKQKQTIAKGAKLRTRKSRNGNDFQTLNIHVDKFCEWLDDHADENGFVNFLVGWKDGEGVHPLIKSEYKKVKQG